MRLGDYEPEERYILLILYPSHQITSNPFTFLWVQQRFGNQGEIFSFFFVVLRIELVHLKCVLYH